MPNPTTHYQIGGSLQLDSPTYVTRRADAELYDGLKTGDFCYVLNSRQMGKSSLRVRTMARLQGEGVACVAVQMTDIIDEETTPEQFYAGVIDSITQDLSLDFDNEAWWEANASLSLVNRFSKFLAVVLLRAVPGNLVIFIDEVDRVLSLPFKVNGFFAAIRECYNKRADVPDFRRLTFALLGVATPSDLIEDKRSTPFNVGRAIELTGFTPEEAQPLAAGLGVPNGAEVLAAILNWTGGQPFLTQKVCRLVAAQVARGQSVGQVADGQAAVFQMSPEFVTDLIQSQVIRNWQSNDEPEHLRTIRDRLVKNEQKAARWLGLYQRIWAEGGLPTDGANTDHIELRLSGLVVERQGWLRVYNPIYREIFNLDWAVQALAELRSYASELEAWLVSGRADSSRLLRGQALVEAKTWSADKMLPPEDYAFLAASQELATAEAKEKQQTAELALKELEQRLKHSRPYENALEAWLNSQKEDKSRLLRGNALLEAKAWSADKVLPPEDYAFLTASQELATAEAEVEVEMLEAVNREVTARIDSANRRLRTGSGILLGTMALAVLAGRSAFLIHAAAREQRAGAKQQLEKAGEQIEIAQIRLNESQVTAEQAERDKALAEEEKAEAKMGLEDAKEEGERIRAESEARIAEADRQVEYASVQVQQVREQVLAAQADMEQAEAAQLLAQQKADEAQLQVVDARQAEANAKEDLTLAIDSIGSELERKGTAILRRSDMQMTGLNTLLDAVDVGNELNRLIMLVSSQNEANLSLDEYPAISPLLALRKSLNSVLETTELEGSDPRFSEDGQQILTSSASDNVSLVYDRSGQLLNELEGSDPRFSEDGQQILTSSFRDNRSLLYDRAGQLLNELEGSDPRFSKDGQKIVTTFPHQDLSRVYDLAGNLLSEFPGSSSARHLGFTPDSKYLFTQTNDGFYHLWQLDTGLDDLLAKGCDWVRPYLQSNPEETRAHFCLEGY